MTLAPDGPSFSLPQGWSARPAVERDLAALVALRTQEQHAAKGSGSVDEEAVRSETVGPGSWTRRQIVLVDAQEQPRGWAAVHDRAAGRTNVAVLVDRVLSTADDLAAQLYAWCAEVAGDIARERGEPSTQLDASLTVGDPDQPRWLAAAGARCTRTWLQMSRPVAASDGAADAFPPPRDGVVVRRVAQHEDGSPVGAELRAVHQVLEESFEDHFNSYRESFGEFVQRLREDPGHHWDHWWIATVEIDGRAEPGGALVGTTVPPDSSGAQGSYIDYIGVHRRARGRGVAKGLLHAVIADAAARGRNRVTLEVDADSPTQADGLYRSMGWVTAYRTESWHRDIDVRP